VEEHLEKTSAEDEEKSLPSFEGFFSCDRDEN
jgi:hypothetical protein